VAATKESSKVVLQLLEQLPNEQRDAIELAYWEGLSQTDIAARTGTPLGTVKTRMRLGLSKLAQGAALASRA
jgi:RNA polymerase sigma-70 factor (ECF subfamily)